MKPKNVNAIELVIFKPKPGFNTEKVKASLLSLTPILEAYNGYIGRELALNQKNKWMDLIFWESMEDAKFAAADVMENEKALKAFEVIDKQKMEFFHFEPVNNGEQIE